MGFVISVLRMMRQHDSIMVVVDMLTKVVHFIPVNTFSMSDITQFFTSDMVRLHGFPKNILSDRM